MEKKIIISKIKKNTFIIKQLLFLFIKLVFIFKLITKINRVIRLKPKSKILLCTIAKKENLYIKEFIDYYHSLKVDKIILYDNNEVKEENFFDILKNEIENNFVKIINLRGFIRPQKKAYNHCYKYNKYDYEWIAFYDVDEFLYILNSTDLNKFLSSSIFKNCQSIIINWKYYGDNNKVFYEPKPVKERFTKPVNLTDEILKNKFIYSAAKTIVRGGLNLVWAHFPHYLKNTINCRPNGKVLNDYFSPPEYSTAYIKHFTTKSTEEYIEKLSKGDVFEISNDQYIINKIKEYYFLFNKITKEKINLINNKLKYNIKIN